MPLSWGEVASLAAAWCSSAPAGTTRRLIDAEQVASDGSTRRVARGDGATETGLALMPSGDAVVMATRDAVVMATRDAVVMATHDAVVMATRDALGVATRDALGVASVDAVELAAVLALGEPESPLRIVREVCAPDATVTHVFTPYGVLVVEPTAGLVIVALAPGISATDLQARSEPTLKITESVTELEGTPPG
ncbi:MAG: hypothetical protein EXR75_06165 [Myxococcales bacterium]|nr:hypothetical protein [Myxococcales bacterium]